jgi:hypothetical protein
MRARCGGGELCTGIKFLFFLPQARPISGPLGTEVNKPMLTKMHYRAIATIFKSNNVAPESSLFQDFVAYFKADNPRFDEKRFIEFIQP